VVFVYLYPSKQKKEMRFFYPLIIALSMSIPMKLYSQDSLLTLEDLIPGGNRYYWYQPQMPHQLTWLGDKLLYEENSSFYFVGKKNEVWLTLKELNESLTEYIRVKYNPASTDGKGNVIYTETPLVRLEGLENVKFPNASPSELLLYTNEGTYVYDIKTQKITRDYKAGLRSINPDYTDAGKAFAYTKDNNLYVETADGKEHAVTSETDKDIVCGQSVHRNEFGIKKGTFWSPQGDRLAFYRMDQTMVEDYPLVDISRKIAKLKNIKYPMAGMKSHHVTVGVYNITTEKTVYLKTGEPLDKYLTNIAWSPDGKYIYIAELNREQNRCMLKQYSAETGASLGTIFVEEHPKYVEPEHPVLFIKNDPEKFLWQSKRDGHNHLYLYEKTGKLIKQVTSGGFDVLSVVGMDEKGENLYYISTEKPPKIDKDAYLKKKEYVHIPERHIYSINLNDGSRKCLTVGEDGVHGAILSASGRYICDTYSSQYNSGKAAIVDTRTGKRETFHTAKNPYGSIELPEITLGSIKANDGTTDLCYRLVKPQNLEPGKKYPVIVYVYGGPKLQLVENGWMGQARGWDIYMAQKGYVVFTLDNRGSENRGLDFENITHRRLGVIETQDQMSGIDFLKSLPYVDADRIGVHGWSFGGFMTLNLILRHPEVFKVGVAGGPVTSWRFYEIMYGERYMDTPRENPKGYMETNMLSRAGALEGRLLIIHGDEDPTVVMQNSLQFIGAAVKSGTHPDLFIYPGHGHNILGKDRVHLHEHITRYFDDFLK